MRIAPYDENAFTTDHARGTAPCGHLLVDEGAGPVGNHRGTHGPDEGLGVRADRDRGTDDKGSRAEPRAHRFETPENPQNL
ncbi:hypothetical protein ACFC09_13680 [Streptomyces sp. NPDC056161]|uniref:hypothetical protein n=1 Tax=Streptomyces sp. NPDC056161 TaxID=3345732 RepID=UPI0035E208E2